MSVDGDLVRAEMLDAWDHQAAGWGRQADSVREHAMPVSLRMLELVGPEPGERVLELAAGPGDTGFLAAKRVAPDGTLICSDASEAMLGVARERAADQGVENVEFRQLQLEWIDLETASVDAIMCRWGLMLCLDPAAALSECRRVLKPGGRLAAAVWDAPDANPWMTIPSGTLIELGLNEPPPPGRPGPFALAAPGAFATLLEDAGFQEVAVEPVTLARRYDGELDFLGGTLDLSSRFSRVWRELADEQRRRVRTEIATRTAEFADPGGGFTLPGRSLVAAALA